jgi:hypothetical protein
VIIVCGHEARRGRNHGLVIERLRTDDGEELAAGEYFTRLGGYLTAQPADREPATRPAEQRVGAGGPAG